MATVNIVTSDKGWILERLAREISERIPYVRSELVATKDDDLQYYVTYSAKKERVSALEAACFTHLEVDKAAADKFFDVAKSVDLCICQSERYENVLRAAGVQSVATVSPGVDLGLFEPVVKIGVVGRTYHTGRKGEALVRQVMDVPGIEWHFTGEGWPGPARRLAGEAMPAFYNAMDYILVPSLYEGGPMCVLEAMACGVPIIAPPVGWVDQFPHIEFQIGDASDLRRVLEGVVSERARLRQTVSDRTWENWALGHDQLFQSLFRAHGLTPTIHHGKANASVGKVALALHGTEHKTLGGPSVRVPETARRMKALGVDASVIRVPDPAITDADIVHGYNVWSPQSSLAMARRARSLGKRFVLSPIYLDLGETALWNRIIPDIFRDTADVDAIDEKVASATARFAADAAREGGVAEPLPGYHAVVREIVSLADHVIHLSEVEKRALAAIGADTAPSSIVHNPVDTERYSTADPSLFHQAYGLRDFVLCVARVEPRKNQLMLLHALRDTDLPIVLIGGETNPAYAELLDRYESERVHRLGRFEPNSDLLLSAIAAAKVVVLPSWTEGAPLSALEAAAAGASLVLSDRSGEQEYLGSYARYCDPSDPASIKREIVAAFHEPRDEHRCAAQKAFVDRNYSWSTHVASTLDIYRKTEERDLSASGHDGEPFAENVRVPLVYDLTTVANHKGRLTGITRAEFALAEALLESGRYDLTFIVWNDELREHLIVPEISVRAGNVAGALAGSVLRTVGPGDLPPNARLFVGGSAWMQSLRYVPATQRLAEAHGLCITLLIHDLIPLLSPHWYKEGYASVFEKNLTSLVSSVGEVVAYSENTRRDVENFVLARNIFIPPIRLFRLGDDTPLEEFVDTDLPEEVSLLADKPFVLTVGAIHSRKNHRLLHEVWARLRRDMGNACPYLVIVGGVGWDGEPTARAMREDPAVSDRILILKSVGDGTLEWLYENCRFTVYPSLYEGWGLPVGESLAHGKICLASAVSSIPEIAPDCTDLIDPLDAREWLTRIRFYASSADARAEREAHIKATYRRNPWAESAASIAPILRSPAPPTLDQYYLPGTEVKLSEAGRSKGVSLRGWYPRESWGTWSSDLNATVSLKLERPVLGPHILQIRTSAMMSPQSLTRCVIALNGEPLGTIQMKDTAAKTWTFDVPAELLAGKSSVEVAFMSEGLAFISAVVSSAKGDLRRVGIGALSVALLEASDRLSVTRESNLTPGLVYDLLEADNAHLVPTNAGRNTSWGVVYREGLNRLALPIDTDVTGGVTLNVRFRAVANDDNGLKVNVVANNTTQVGTIRAGSSEVQETSIHIPADAIGEARPLILDFVGGGERSPAAMGLGGMTANSALGLFSIEVSSDEPHLPADLPPIEIFSNGGQLLLGHVVDVSDAVVAEPYLVPGTWHAPEAFGRWTNGEEGKILLVLPSDAAATCSIVATVNCIKASSHAPAEVIIKVDGEQVAFVSTTEVDPFEMDFALSITDAQRQSGRVILSISTNHAASPQEHLGMPDDRCLGLFVQALRASVGPAAEPDGLDPKLEAIFEEPAAA